MHILLLNGSPRRQGNIAAMLETISREAEMFGADTETIRVADLRFAPCSACMKCRPTKRCVLPPDDAHRVADALRRADALVVGAPCYWGNMPGQLKLLFDRLVGSLIDDSAGLMPRPLHKGKRLAIVTASTAAWPFSSLFGQTRGAVSAVRKVTDWSGFRLTGTLEKGGTRRHPELTEAERKRCRQLARRLVK